MSQKGRQAKPAIGTEQIAEQVSALGRRMVDYLDARVGTMGLTAPQAVLLRELERPMAMNEVAGRMHCDASNVTGIVDRLESRGLVERRARAGDRRVKELVLTEEGRRVRVEVDKVIGRTPGISVLSSAEQGLLHRLLARALDGFGD